MTAVHPHPMMQCGHTANAVQGDRPCCAICAPSPDAYAINDAPPSLEDRLAQCSCGKTVPSDSSGRLAFFEYRGPGAPNRVCATCRYAESIHQAVNPHTGRVGVTDHIYVPFEYEFDSWYCGHSGWD